MRLIRNVQEMLRNRHFTNASSYVALQAAQSAIGLLFTILYANRMAPSEFGLIATYTSFSSLVGIVLYLSVKEKVYFAIMAREPNVGVLVSSVVWLMLAIGVLSLPILMSGALLLRATTIAGLPTLPHVLCAQVSAIGLLLVSTVALTFQAGERIAIGAAVNFSVFALFSAVNLCLLFLVAMNSVSFVQAHAGAYGLGGAAATLYLFRTYGTQFSLSRLREALRFSVPLIPHHLAHWARAGADRLILSTVLTTAATGVYGIAAAYSGLALLLVEAFAIAYAPRFFRYMDDIESNRNSIRRVLIVSVGVASGIATTMALFAREVIQEIAAPEYWQASAYVPLLTTAIPLFVIYTNLVPALMYKRLTALASAITVASSVTGVAVSLVLIGRIQIWAMPIGGLVLNACMAVLVAKFAQRHVQMKWPWLQMAFFCLLPVTAYFWTDGVEFSLLLRVAAAIGTLVLISTVIRRDFGALLRG